jgi:hypothetical protein
MPRERPSIIAEGTRAAGRAGLSRLVFGAALGFGIVAAIVYARADLTLSHYDARAHLVVARRVVDSLTPGWRQLGGVWLPLPHLVNLVPSQFDFAYRTGGVAVAISILVLSWGLSALARYTRAVTGSWAAALAGPALVLANQGVLYLQSTPMTEPMLLGVSFLALAAMGDLVDRPARSTAVRAGWWLAALVLVRYEGWLIAAGLVSLLALTPVRAARRLAVTVVLFPAAAIVLFLVMSRASTGSWLQTSGFFVPENASLHHPVAALQEVWDATNDLAGRWLVLGGVAGVLVALVRGRTSPRALLPVALVAAGALPFFAFYQGHPHRVRYMVPLVAACGALAALAIGELPRRARGVAALALVAASIVSRPPFSREAPMVREAQWETPFRLARRAVTAELAKVYDGTPILASMGSLGHYMQESSSIGLGIRNFLHEGNGDLWTFALRSPKRHVRWILIEERAEGGDMLAARAKADPEFLEGFRRVAEGGGLALYERN